MKKIDLTILNAMAHKDFAESLNVQKQWGLTLLDLKDSIFGRNIEDLNSDEAVAAAEMAKECGFETYCLSTGIFNDDIEKGESYFFQQFNDNVDNILCVASALKPKAIRLLAGYSRKRQTFTNCANHIEMKHAWVIPMYQQAIDRIAGKGYQTVIENEIGDTLFANPLEIVDFFTLLDRDETAGFTWDIQNMWQCGTFPDVSVYNTLREIITYVHVKGGRKEEGVMWQSTLAQASWPVTEILNAVINDALIDVLCLNSCHGKVDPLLSDIVGDDILFLQKHLQGGGH